MIWKKVKEHINKHDVGDIIYRKELKQYENSNNDTIDLYRYYLEKTWFLETVDRGQYKLLHKIPEHVSSTKIRKKAEYIEKNSWVKWFLDPKDKIKFLL